jgi:flavodoxin
MEIKQVTLIYLSPTGTTQKVLERIAKGITLEDGEHINLTLLDELVIIEALV